MISDSNLEKLEFNKVLNYLSRYAVTENGKAQILSLAPLTEPEVIRTEGELVTQAKNILIKQTPPPLIFLSNLEESLSKSNIEGAVLDKKKILEVLNLASVSRNLSNFLKSNLEIAGSFKGLIDRLFIDKVFEHHISRVIDENGEIRENASPKLAEIKSEIKIKQNDLIKSVNRIIKSLSETDVIREDYLTLRDGRIVIPVKVEHKRHIRGFIHSESSTGQTVYIEPEETLELNNEIVSLSFAEKREIERLLKELTKLIGGVSAELKRSLQTVSYIDSLFARAKYSIEIIGSFPVIENSKPFHLIEGRHPLLLKKLGKDSAIPLNLEINKNKVIIITGPNTGGKTVVLKTVGLLILMVQSGIHVPVHPDSNFHFFNSFMLDIGDEQSIESDLSTFSSHLSNIKNILNQADKDSLVLLDEIGTGTDPAEGSALAIAVLISLRDKESTVLATTHHGNLKLIATELNGFENAAMEFDNENLRPTYKFKQGIPGSSYAFEIAKRIGLDDNFLTKAKNYLDVDKHQVEKFLVEIEGKSKKLEEKLNAAEIENSRLTGLTNLYRQNIDKLDEEKKEILKNAKNKAELYLADVNKKFENVIKNIKESKADKESIKSAQKIIKELKEKNKDLYTETVDLNNNLPNFRIGDFANIKNTATVGLISELDSEKNKAVLSVGSLKMQVELSRLVPSKREKERSEVQSSVKYFSSDTKSRLDIRGEKPEEAEFEVIKFLDSAYSGGLERVEILHGKGTGALKKMVHEILKHYEKVKIFYFAPIEFGGEGITIVELK